MQRLFQVVERLSAYRMWAEEETLSGWMHNVILHHSAGGNVAIALTHTTEQPATTHSLSTDSKDVCSVCGVRWLKVICAFLCVCSLVLAHWHTHLPGVVGAWHTHIGERRLVLPFTSFHVVTSLADLLSLPRTHLLHLVLRRSHTVHQDAVWPGVAVVLAIPL